MNPSLVICNILNQVKTILASVGFGVAVIMLIWGGIVYMTAGGDDEKAKKARTLITNAIIGVAIILAALFILTLVQGFLVGAGVVINPFASPCAP